MQRFIKLTVRQGPMAFGESGATAKILVDADLIQIIKEEPGGSLVVLGAGLGEIEVKESVDQLRRILCEKKERSLDELARDLSEK